MRHLKDIVFLSGSSHKALGQEVAKHLKVSEGKIQIETFPDEEIGVHVLENVRGRDVFVLQTIARRPNHYLMELLITLDALKRASARSITVVLPYMGYSRQDRMEKEGAPITAKLVANLLETAGASRILTLDLHTDQIQGFFDIPVVHLSACKLLVEKVRKEKLGHPYVMSPDIGRVKLAKAFAEELGCDFGVIDKERVSAHRVEKGAVLGRPEGKNVILVDDIYSTGKTLHMAAKTCLDLGAKSVSAAVVHMVGSAVHEESAVDKLWVTDSVPQTTEMEVVSIAPLIAKAISSI
ncbi:MAG: ribose-phosphate pyrophosphokinase [Verrucomicrobia bacterium]|nr:ribose-phosphate pyrophosphokinase [Verrucomicrobiota bacterium]